MYAVVNDCTPNNATIVAISNDPSELIDLQADEWRAIKLIGRNANAKVGDRIDLDWDECRVNLADCM